MKFEVRGKVLGMQMPDTWEYYQEGLLVMREEDLVTFSGEVRDDNGTPIDVIVKNSPIWGGWVVLFRNYAVPKCDMYQKFGVFTNAESAIYVARLILTCNRAFQYNWKGITSIIMRGAEFDLDTATAVAFLHIMLPKTKEREPIFNPPLDYQKPISNPVVFVERKNLDDMKEDARDIRGIHRKTRSYTALFMMNYIHHIPGISFFNEEEVIAEVKHFVETGDSGLYERDCRWTPTSFAEAVDAAEKRLSEIFLKYANGDVPVEYLKSMVNKKDIVAPGYSDPITPSKEPEMEEAVDAVDEA